MKQKKNDNNFRGGFEYRVRYNPSEDHFATDSYHYYTAPSAEEALNYHNAMMLKHGSECQILSVEKKNPYSNKWEDESYVLNQGA